VAAHWRVVLLSTIAASNKQIVIMIDTHEAVKAEAAMTFRKYNIALS
jgi:hypothetical protein